MKKQEKPAGMPDTKRLQSLDVLRGFDMFWIVGGASLVTALAGLSGARWLDSVALHMTHVPWIGFHFYDLIFPLFMFISGVAIPLSQRAKQELPPRSIVLKGFKRMVILILLGILYNGVFRDGFENPRYASVLGQIGIAWFFASVIVLYSRSFRTRLFWLAAILALIAILQLFVPVPGIGAGVLTPEGCINGYIDRNFLPGRVAYNAEGKMIPGDGVFDALGILCIVSAIGITLMGTVAGHILQQKKFSEYRKTAILAVTGIVLIIAALVIAPVYPVIKVIWTTTYNLLAGGISFLLIALFYLIIDVWQFNRWSFFFKVIGMNSIFIYLFYRIIPMDTVSLSFFGWLVNLSVDAGKVIIFTGVILLEWLLLYFMYRKKIFLRV